MRVLHGTTGNVYGGLEALLSTLARHRGLAPGLDQRFAACFPGRLADDLRALGCAPEVLGPVRFSRPWTVVRARRAFRRVLARVRPDAVICHATWPLALLGGECRRAGVPVAFWQHDIHDGVSWLDRRARALAPRDRPALAIAGSRFAAANTPVLFPGIEAEVVRCPVAPPPADAGASREALRRDLGAGPNDVVLVQASRMERLKGTHVTVEAMGRLARVPGWVLWVAGGSDRPHERLYRDELEASARALGIGGRVRFLGARSDVRAVLAASDVYIQANVDPETFGIAFVEALYAGLPVVTTSLGGALEIVDERCGVLVPPNDAPALAEAAGVLVADAGRRLALGRAGPARAASLCAPEAVLGHLESVLEGLVAHCP